MVVVTRLMDSLLKKGRLAKLVSLLGSICVALGCSIITPDPPPKEEMWPNWSPDSQQLVYECYLDGPIGEGSRSILDFDEGEGIYQSFYAPEAADICITDLNVNNQIRLIDDSGRDWKPVWSPDGTQIAYFRWDGIYTISPDGQHKRQLVPLTRGEFDNNDYHDATFLVWSPDGKHLLFSACLDNLDRDIYVVDAKSGQVVNLTPESRQQDIMPQWTLDGTKIVYLSTNSSLWSKSCELKRDAPHHLMVMTSDGRDISVIYNEAFYYAFIAVSNDGQILFVTDMVSKTAGDFFYPPVDNRILYRINVEGKELIKLPAQDNHFLVSPSWSPDGTRLVYRGIGGLELLNIQSGETSELPAIEPLIENFVWSPDGKRIAATVSIQLDQASDKEEHIYIFDVQNNTISPLLPQ